MQKKTKQKNKKNNSEKLKTQGKETGRARGDFSFSWVSPPALCMSVEYVPPCIMYVNSEFVTARPWLTSWFQMYPPRWVTWNSRKSKYACTLGSWIYIRRVSFAVTRLDGLVNEWGSILSVYIPLADLGGGASGARPPYGSRFFRFDMQNFRNVAASGVHGPLYEVHAPLTGNPGSATAFYMSRR